jgi:hypothetical protein
LPTWLRELFIIKRKNALCITPQQELDHHLVCKKIERMVPNKATIRDYSRIFKWTVGFCTWMPDHPKHDKEVHPFGDAIGSKTIKDKEDSNEDAIFSPPSDDADIHEADMEEAEKKLRNMTIKSKLAGPKKGAPPSTARVTAGKASNVIDTATGKDRYGRDIKKLISATKNIGNRGEGQGHAFGPVTYTKNQSRINIVEGRLKGGIPKATSKTVKGYAGSKSQRSKADMTRDETLKKGKALATRVAASADEIIADAINALGSREKNGKVRHGAAWV